MNKLLEFSNQLHHYTTRLWMDSDVEYHAEGHPGMLGFGGEGDTTTEEQRINIQISSDLRTIREIHRRLKKRLSTIN